MPQLPVSLTPSLIQSWKCNYGREAGQIDRDQMIWINSVRLAKTVLADFLRFSANGVNVISIAVTGSIQRQFLAVTEQHHVSFFPEFITFARLDNPATLMLPFNALNHKDLREVQTQFHQLLMDPTIIKVSYGLPAAFEYAKHWAPAKVATKIQSMFDLGYIFHGYPAAMSLVPGGFVGYKDYHMLETADSLDTMFERCCNIPSSIGIDVPMWDDLFWFRDNDVRATQKEAAQQLASKQLDLFMVMALTLSPRFIPNLQHQAVLIELQERLSRSWKFPTDVTKLELGVYTANRRVAKEPSGQDKVAVVKSEITVLCRYLDCSV